MNRRNLTTRLQNLEQRIRLGTVDLGAEAELYGELVWGDRRGPRCYIGRIPDGARLAAVGGPGGDVLYELVGLDPEVLR